ncbi:MAG: LptA/OstA family protein [Pseudomonadota bacterium]
MLLRASALCLLVAVPHLPLAQGLQVAFQGFNQDSEQAIEIAADAMAINQESGSAELSGNVIIGQGELRLSAPRVNVDYSEEGGISRIEAVGGVTIVTPQEEAEARRAVYVLASDSMLLEGDVLLSQGANAVSADRMNVDLASGRAVLEGRVRTVLQPNE